MLASVDWGAIGALAGISSVLLVIGGAVVKTVRDRIQGTIKDRSRLDKLEIRLFGLPADPDSGAPKLPGEFDHVYQRIDALPDQIVERLRGSH